LKQLGFSQVGRAGKQQKTAAITVSKQRDNSSETAGKLAITATIISDTFATVVP
jgi:hypothetical protein